MKLFIAGKNSIAVDILKYSIENFNFSIAVILNKTENFKNGFQKSLGFYAKLWNIPIAKIEDVYNYNDAIFLSLEYDQIIKPYLFKSKKLFNIHFSLLPAYKGMYTSALPIICDEKEVGVTLHEIDRGIDTGDIIAQEKFKLKDYYTGRDLYLLYIKFGTDLVIKNIGRLINGNYNAYKQSFKGSSYFGKNSINYSDLKIDFRSTAIQLVRQFRAFSFREYQLPLFNGNKIGSWKITDEKSRKNPGSIVINHVNEVQISTIDYDVIVRFDLYDRLWNFCELNYFGKLKELLNVNKFNLETKTQEGWTALMIAVFNGAFECVIFLIESGADVNAENYNKTNVLMYAKSNLIKTGDTRIIKKLINSGAKVSSKDVYGKSVLDWVKDEESEEFLNYFVNLL